MKTPQQLSRQAIEKFKANYQAEFGRTLTDDEIRDIAIRLLRFFDVPTQPLSGKTRGTHPRDVRTK